MTATLRQAVRADVREIQRVRHSVRENRLTSGVISEEEVGWVVELEGRIIGFAIGNAEAGNIWALFMEPEHERQGHGRRLHDEMVNWVSSQGLKRLWLSTGQQTRARRFYETAGWHNAGVLAGGELLFEKHAP